jgi:RNA polymerase sigma factor (sigma-70 family)
VAYRLTGNDDDAQDLVQEVLLRVRRGLGTYQPGNLEGWLSRIATNAFLDEMRRRRRRVVELLPDEPERVIPPEPGADVAAEAEALPDDVHRALQRLTPDYRAAVVLCDVVGLSYEEISATLGIPIGTVRSRIHRGRAQLREALT